ncbi:hypothetical protein GCM10023197_45390 [Gordonia humi]
MALSADVRDVSLFSRADIAKAIEVDHHNTVCNERAPPTECQGAL